MQYPIRGGSRGGQDSFSWENVKSDKYRENYLGHSINAPVGRWQKNKDLLWYDKSQEVNSNANINDELEEIKQKEAEAMAEFLGVSVPKKRHTEQVSKKELQSIINKEEAEVEDNLGNIKGVGFGSVGLNNTNTENISFEDALKQKRERDSDEESDSEEEGRIKKSKKSTSEKEKSKDKKSKEKKSHHHHRHHHKEKHSHSHDKKRSSRSHSRHRRRDDSPKRSSSSRHH